MNNIFILDSETIILSSRILAKFQTHPNQIIKDICIKDKLILIIHKLGIEMLR